MRGLLSPARAAPQPARARRWQATIADLALILFLLAASALESSAPPASARSQAQEAAAARGVSLLAWHETDQTPSLAQWLAENPPDSAERLSITLTYAPGGLAEALAQAQRLAAEAGPAAAPARIVLEPGAQAQAMATLAQEAPGSPGARAAAGGQAGAPRGP